MGSDHDPEQAGVFHISTEQEGGNRATVAMVFRAVDDLKAITEAHFDTVKVKLDVLGTLPLRVAALETRADRNEGRIVALERESEKQSEQIKERRTYRSSTLPLLVFTFLGLLVAAVNIWVAAHA